MTLGQVVQQEARRARPERAPISHPRTWIRTFPQALNLLERPEGGLTGGLGVPGRSWLTHAWVLFESSQEGRDQREDPYSQSLVPQTARLKQVTGCPRAPEPLPSSIAFPESTLPQLLLLAKVLPLWAWS